MLSRHIKIEKKKALKTVKIITVMQVYLITKMIIDSI